MLLPVLSVGNHLNTNAKGLQNARGFVCSSTLPLLSGLKAVDNSTNLLQQIVKMLLAAAPSAAWSVRSMRGLSVSRWSAARLSTSAVRCCATEAGEEMPPDFETVCSEAAEAVRDGLLRGRRGLRVDVGNLPDKIEKYPSRRMGACASVLSCATRPSVTKEYIADMDILILHDLAMPMTEQFELVE